MALVPAAAVAGVLGVGATSTVAIVATAATNLLLATAISTAINVGLSKAFGREDAPKREPIGIITRLRTGGNNPRTLPFGTFATSGSLKWANSWTNTGGDIGSVRYRRPNGFQTRVIALSDLPVQSLNRVWVNGQWCTLVAADPDATARGFGQAVNEFKSESGADCMWIKFYDGTQTTADSFLVNTASAGADPDRQWDNNRIGSGMAYAIVTAYFDPEVFRGFPRVRFELMGARLYDPSQDDTVGGSGTQRKDNPATWGGDGDDLPIVQLLAVLRGIDDGYGNHLYGFQSISDAQLPWAKWIDAINTCRQQVPRNGGGTQKRFKSGGEVEVDREIGDVLEALLTACNGRLCSDGYEIFPIVGAPSATAVATLTDDDIILDLEQTFTPFFGIDDTVNGVTGVYSSPIEGWAEKAAPPIYRPDLETEDGNRRLTASVQMPMVYQDEQAQRLLQASLNEARRARRHTYSITSKFNRLQAGDIIAWNSDRFGYSGKLFRVDGSIELETADVVVDLTEVDPSDHGYDPATDYQPVSVAVGEVLLPSVVPITGWQVSASSVPDENGFGRRPAILLEWDYVDGVRAVVWQVRVAATDVVVATGEAPTPDGEEAALIHGGAILSTTEYEVRGRYRGDGFFPTSWSAWLSVTTGDFRLDAEDLSAAVNAELAKGQQAIDDALANTNLINFEVNRLDGRVDTAEASVVDEAQTRAAEDAALASDITTVEAQLNWGRNMFADSLYRDNAVGSAGHPNRLVDSSGAGQVVSAFGTDDATFDPPSARMDLLAGETKWAGESLYYEILGLPNVNGNDSIGRIRVYPNEQLVCRALIDLRNRLVMPSDPQLELRFRDGAGTAVAVNGFVVNLDRGVGGWKEYEIRATVPATAEYVSLFVEWPFGVTVAAPAGSDLGVKVFDARLERARETENKASALVTQSTTAAALENIAVAQSIESLRAQVGGTDASIERFAQALVDDSSGATEVIGWRTGGGGSIEMITKRTDTGAETKLLLNADDIIVPGTITAAEVNARTLTGDRLILQGVDYTELALNSSSDFDAVVSSQTSEDTVNSSGGWQVLASMSVFFPRAGSALMRYKARVQLFRESVDTTDLDSDVRARFDGVLLENSPDTRSFGIAPDVPDNLRTYSIEGATLQSVSSGWHTLEISVFYAFSETDDTLSSAMLVSDSYLVGLW